MSLETDLAVFESEKDDSGLETQFVVIKELYAMIYPSGV